MQRVKEEAMEGQPAEELQKFYDSIRKEAAETAKQERAVPEDVCWLVDIFDDTVSVVENQN
jgi:hypothetical protein